MGFNILNPQEKYPRMQEGVFDDYCLKRVAE
jgi:hypothetical protein